MLLTLTLLAAAPQMPAALRLPNCAARDLRLATDGADGDFNGMSHSGTYLVIRNVGRRACSVPGLPKVTLRGPGGRELPAMRQVPVGMHPGPVILPVAVPAGGRVATGVRWVSGPVYDTSRKLDVRSVSIDVGGRSVSAPLRAAVFGDGTKPATFEQPVLTAYPPKR